MRKLWNKISYAGVGDDLHFEIKRRIILLNRIAAILFLVTFSLRVIVTLLGFQKITLESTIPFLFIFSILLFPYLNSKGYYKINAFIFSVVSPVFFMVFSIMGQTTNDVVNINHYYVPRLFIMASIVLPLILIETREKGLMYVAIAVNLICILSFDAVVNWIGVPFDSTTIDFTHHDSISKIMLLPALLMVFGFLFLNNLNQKYESKIIGLNTDLQLKNEELGQVNEELKSQAEVIADKNAILEQYNEEVVAQRDVIAEKNELLEQANIEVESVNEMMTDSILYARDIQKAVLNKDELPQGWFAESFIFFKPKSMVSGDFYFFREFEINSIPCIVVAAVDCTGHGVPGGFLSMLGIALINEILQNEQVTNAADILNFLRKKVKIALNQTGAVNEQKDGMDMALCVYYPETKRLDYAGARNPLLVINDKKEIQIYKGDRQPIGIYIKEKPFMNHNVQLSGNEMLYMFSDGLQDQFGGSDGKKLKFSQLQQVLLESSNISCKEQKDHLESFLSEWIAASPQSNNQQIDDILLMGMRV